VILGEEVGDGLAVYRTDGDVKLSMGWLAERWERLQCACCLCGMVVFIGAPKMDVAVVQAFAVGAADEGGNVQY
jgi:hypothetical protein